MCDDVPGRLARVLVEPGRPGAPQLEAKVEAERKARAHEPDELPVREQRDDLDAGYTVLQYDRERRVLRGGGQRRPGEEEGEDRESAPHSEAMVESQREAQRFARGHRLREVHPEAAPVPP